jgi:hypothetical protein|tara:strand:+ start:73 stop:747 length:675 start_codon:yes stop_codon:yes gene_type:complete
MKEFYDFNSQMFGYFLNNSTDEKINFSEITNWHSSHPYYRLNYYNKIQISQVPGIYYLFNEDWLSQFDTIVEIGSYNGGLSSYIFDHKNPNATFVSYDINPSINEIKNRNDIDFRVGDCFEDSTFKEIVSFIEKKGKTLLICDGGNKTKEFNDFSKYLKKDDIIILHDYLSEEFDWGGTTEYWQWPYGYETSWDEIKDSVKNNNLEKYRYTKFNFFLWGAFIKK